MSIFGESKATTCTPSTKKAEVLKNRLTAKSAPQQNYRAESSPQIDPSGAVRLKKKSFWENCVHALFKKFRTTFNVLYDVYQRPTPPAQSAAANFSRAFSPTRRATMSLGAR